LSEKLLISIDEINKVRVDYKYNDLYLTLEQEIDKALSVTQDKPDWSYVYEHSVLLLENNTKDLKLASWWIYATLKTKDIFVFSKNLSIFIEFINAFNNEELFPKSMKGKINTINWLEDNLVQEFVTNEIYKTSIKENINLNELFENLSEATKSLLNINENRFRKIILYINKILKSQLEEPKKIEEIQEIIKKEPFKTEEKETQTITLSLKNVEVIDEISAKKLFLDTKEALAKLSSFYRENDLESLKAIKITRFLSLINVEDLPYAEEQRTLINPPPMMEIENIKTFIKQKEYKKALALIEENIEVCPFWIDGHYLAYDIFANLKNEKNMHEIKNVLIGFIKINEEVLDLKFSDNTPFCSNKTKQWIKNSFNETNKNKEQNKENTDKTHNKLDDVNQLLKEDKFEEAIEKIVQLYENTNSYEEKFHLRLEQIQILNNFDRKNIAFALVKDLEKDIKIFNLSQWNPKLVSTVYLFILNSFNRNDIEYAYLKKIYNKLSKLNMQKALKIDFV